MKGKGRPTCPSRPFTKLQVIFESAKSSRNALNSAKFTKFAFRKKTPTYTVFIKYITDEQANRLHPQLSDPQLSEPQISESSII